MSYGPAGKPRIPAVSASGSQHAGRERARLEARPVRDRLPQARDGR